MWSRIVGHGSNSFFQWQHLQASGPRQTVALRVDDPLEPSRKRCRLTKLRQFLPGHNECFLSNILREIGVAQYGKRTTEGHVLKANHQFAKGFASDAWGAVEVCCPKHDLGCIIHLNVPFVLYK